MSEEFNNENVVYENLGRIMGLSAYELAVRNGFTGTEAEWLESLIGKTAYEVAVQQGFEGNVSAWLASLKGDTGVSIANIAKTGTDGNTDTYTITLDNGSTRTFTVKNGKEISSIVKQSSTATKSTLLITFNDSTTTTVTIPNGTGISSVEKIGTVGLVDTYQINFTDKDPITFTVTNGTGITSVQKTGSNGIVDTYTITYSNGQTFTYELTNGIDTVPIDYTSQLIADDVYIERGEIGTKLHRWQDGDFSKDTNRHYSSIRIEVKAGQMFKLSVSGSANYPAYVLADSELTIVDKNVGALTDYYLPVKFDGYLLIDTKKDYDSSIRKVTIFDEVEKNQTLLNQAISAIPTVAEVAEEVLSNLPRAEQGAF